jgi:hypothetical protein
MKISIDISLLILVVIETLQADQAAVLDALQPAFTDMKIILLRSFFSYLGVNWQSSNNMQHCSCSCAEDELAD